MAPGAHGAHGAHLARAATYTTPGAAWRSRARVVLGWFRPAMLQADRCFTAELESCLRSVVAAGKCVCDVFLGVLREVRERLLD